MLEIYVATDKMSRARLGPVILAPQGRRPVAAGDKPVEEDPDTLVVKPRCGAGSWMPTAYAGVWLVAIARMDQRGAMLAPRKHAHEA
jgi:hypothetical protein